MLLTSELRTGFTKLVLFLGMLWLLCKMQNKGCNHAVITGIYQYRYVGRIKLHKTSKLSEPNYGKF